MVVKLNFVKANLTKKIAVTKCCAKMSMKLFYNLLPANKHRRAAQYNTSSVCRHVAHSGGRLSAN